MAGRGPTPKPAEKRLGHRSPEQTTELTGGAAKAPRLPNRRKLSAATRAWWDDWVASPQSQHFLVTDWRRLLMLVPMVEAYNDGDLARFSEIRLNESKLGATPEDRLRLRWRLRDADQATEREEKTATRAPSRRQADPRLKLVEGGGS